MVRVDPLKVCHTISMRIEASNITTDIIPIVYNNPSLIKQEYPQLPDNIEDFGCNGYLTDLYSVERPYGLAEIQLPDYLDEDTKRERLLKTHQMQWESENFLLNLYTTKKRPPLTKEDWNFIGSIPILNTAGFKYTRHRPFDLFTHNLARSFGKWASAGIEIQITGKNFGPLDTITIDGSWHQETALIQPDFTPVLIDASVTSYQEATNLLVGVASRQILPSRVNRLEVEATNNSTSNTIYVGLNGVTPTASANSGAIAPGNTLVWKAGVTGIINAIASGVSTNITVKERYNQ